MNSSSDNQAYRSGHFFDSIIESKILCLILKSRRNAGIILPLLSPEDFKTFAHQQIFLAIRQLNEATTECSVENITSMLSEKGLSALTDDLWTILSTEASPYELGILLKELKRMTYARSLLAEAVETALGRHDLSGRTHEVEQAVENVLQQPCLPLNDFNLMEVSTAISAAEQALKKLPVMLDLESKTVRNLMRNWIRALEKEYENMQEDGRIMTGIEELDKVVSGLLRGNLYLINGEKSSGKTSFYLNIVANIVTEYDSKGTVLLFTPGMPRDHLLTRLVSISGQIDYLRCFGRINLAETDWHKLVKGLGNLTHGRQIIIEDTPSLSTDDISMLAKEIWRHQGLSLIIVDDSWLVTADSGNKAPENIYIALKGLAEELGIPIIAVANTSYDGMPIDGTLHADVVITVKKPVYSHHYQQFVLQILSVTFPRRGVSVDVPIHLKPANRKVYVVEDQLESSTLH